MSIGPEQSFGAKSEEKKDEFFTFGILKQIKMRISKFSKYLKELQAYGVEMTTNLTQKEPLIEIIYSIF